MPTVCPRCQAAAAPLDRFCDECGLPFPESARPEGETPDAQSQQVATPQSALPQSALPQSALPQSALPQSALPQSALPLAVAQPVVAAPRTFLPSPVIAASGPLARAAALAEEDAPAPVRLEVKINPALRANAQGVLEVRLTNLDAAATLTVTLKIDSGLPLVGHGAYRVELPPRQPCWQHVAFRGAGEGEHEVAFHVEVEGEKPGTWEAKMVAAISASATNQVINITHTQNITGHMVVGTESNAQTDLGGVLAAPAAGDFVNLPLVRPQRVEAVIIKRVLRGYEARPARANKLCLRVPTDRGLRNVCLLGKREVSLGKERGNDIVLRVLPSSPENDNLSVSVSRRHALVGFTPTGAQWTNLDCGNGTTSGGRVVPAREKLMVREGLTARPADVLTLGFWLYNDEPVEITPAYAEFERRWPGPPTPPPEGHARAVRVSRHDNLPGREEYVIFQRAIGLGSGPASAVRVPHASVRPTHAQIVLLAGGLWLEAIHPTRVNGQELPADHLAPLAENMVIQLGEATIDVTRYQQYHVDVAPE